MSGSRTLGLWPVIAIGVEALDRRIGRPRPLPFRNDARGVGPKREGDGIGDSPNPLE